MIMIESKTREGMTIGLIDSIICLCRLVSERDLDTKEVQEALKDLRSDDKVIELLTK
jgi:hypothetical protein